MDYRILRLGPTFSPVFKLGSRHPRKKERKEKIGRKKKKGKKKENFSTEYEGWNDFIYICKYRREME